jgi:hypothetical protein
METKCLFTSSSNEIFLMYCLLGYCHLWQYPTKQVEATLVPHLVAWFKALLALPCWQMCWRGSPCLPIKEACFWEQNESVWEWSDEKKRERVAAALLPYAAECVSWELSLSGCDPPPPCIYCILSLSLIKWTSPVDVGALPNHLKYCVSVLSLQWATIRTPPVRLRGSQNLLTIGIRAHGLKWCLIFAQKLKLSKLCFDHTTV